MYRDDLEAALERAADLERELERAHAEHERDEQKIAELKQKLDLAQRDAREAQRKRKSGGKRAADDQRAADWKGGRDDRAPTDNTPVKSAAESAQVLADADEAVDSKPQEPRKKLRVDFVAVLGIAVIVSTLFVYMMQRGSSRSRSSARPVTTPAPTSEPAPTNRDPLTYVDVSGNLPQAYALARAELPDAELTSITADYVEEGGIANLSYDPTGGEVRYYFMSPARANAPDPPAIEPVGVPHHNVRPFCKLKVKVYPGHKLSVRTGSDGERDCGSPVAPPRCTLGEIWAIAKSHGAQAGALARVEYGPKGWLFKIVDSGKTLFRETIADSCAAK